MDNYKIKVKDEAESKEAQELFFDLGYEWRGSKRDITNLDATHIYADDGFLTFGFNDFNFRGSDNEELTLPQLRDLVVLKRNDMKDATHRDKQQNSIYLTSDKVIYYWDAEWLNSAINKSNDYENYIANSLTLITQPQDPALISGAEAKLAWANGKEVQISHKELDGIDWTDLHGSLMLSVFEADHMYIFRLKPQTIKLELEIPAPCKAKIGGRDDASFVLNVGRHQYCYNNEEDYTKARDSLEAVFDAAVRGANS